MQSSEVEGVENQGYWLAFYSIRCTDVNKTKECWAFFNEDKPTSLYNKFSWKFCLEFIYFYLNLKTDKNSFRHVSIVRLDKIN